LCLDRRRRERSRRSPSTTRISMKADPFGSRMPYPIAHGEISIETAAGFTLMYGRKFVVLDRVPVLCAEHPSHASRSRGAAPSEASAPGRRSSPVATGPASTRRRTTSPCPAKATPRTSCRRVSIYCNPPSAPGSRSGGFRAEEEAASVTICSPDLSPSRTSMRSPSVAPSFTRRSSNCPSPSDDGT